MSTFDDASLVMIPSGYKASKVYSVKPTDGTGDLTFTRSLDTATRVGPDGLIEKVRTNLALFSEQFDNAYWTKSQATITANATTAPNGTLTAEKFIENAGSVTPECSRTPIATSNGIFTLSVFAKASERNFLIINNNDGTGSQRTWFNLTTGVVGTTAAASTAFIENVGNGWFRCSATNPISNFGSATSAFQIGSADGVQTYTGDGTSGIFIWGAQMELSDFGATPYIPTTTAAVSVGMLANVPRLDYEGGGCPKLLLEPQRTNLITFSEQLNNAAWITNGAVTITANTTISPDGFQNADSIIATGAFNGVFKTIGVANATQHTFSLYVKNISLATSINIGVSTNPSGATINFNAVTGVIASVGAAITASSVSDAGNGWYRISATYTTTGTSNDFIIFATGAMSFCVFGCQLEAGAYATSYIPTLGAAVTRSADAASKTGISALIGQTEGTLFVEFFYNEENKTPTGNDKSVMRVESGGGFDNEITIMYYGNEGSSFGKTIRVSIKDGGVLQSNIKTTQTMVTGYVKVALAYKANDFALAVNGVVVATDNSGSVPTCANFSLNEVTRTQSDINPKQALLFKTRLTNAQLAELTA